MQCISPGSASAGGRQPHGNEADGEEVAAPLLRTEVTKGRSCSTTRLGTRGGAHSHLGD